MRTTLHSSTGSRGCAWALGPCRATSLITMPVHRRSASVSCRVQKARPKLFSWADNEGSGQGSRRAGEAEAAEEEEETFEEFDDDEEEEEQHLLHAGHMDHALLWPPPSWSPTTHELHVFWDLDNKKPSDWTYLPEVVETLRQDLKQGGTIKSMSAYANRITLAASTAEQDDLEELVETRCSLCGRRCKSRQDLEKHFKQLHQREHKKRCGHKPKSTRKYLESAKGQRYREAYADVGMSRKLGSKGRTLKALLGQLGVRIREVAVQKQAADIALIADVKDKLSAHRNAAAPSQKQQVLVLISDDYGFQAILRQAKNAGWSTAVVSCQQDKFEADAWLPWEFDEPDERLPWEIESYDSLLLWDLI